MKQITNFLVCHKGRPIYWGQNTAKVKQLKNQFPDIQIQKIVNKQTVNNFTHR